MLILVEIAVQGISSPIVRHHVPVAEFRPEAAGHTGQVAVFAVFPTALLRDGLQYLRGRAPTFLGGLRQVAVGQLLPGLCQEALAGLLMNFGCSWSSPRSGCRYGGEC